MFSHALRTNLLRSRTTSLGQTIRLAAAARTTPTRPYHASPTQLQKDKKANLMDKDSINTDANEYSKSAGDNTSAATADAAFSADKARPEEQHDTAAREAEEQGISNPLNVSPANHEISQPRKGTEGGAQGSEAQTGSASQRAKTSGGGSSPKAGGKKSGGGGHL